MQPIALLAQSECLGEGGATCRKSNALYQVKYMYIRLHTHIRLPAEKGYLDSVGARRSLGDTRLIDVFLREGRVFNCLHAMNL